MFATAQTRLIEKTKLFCHTLMLCGASLAICANIFSAHAELRLAEWKNYAPLAEQGAICASFSALMETQSLLNPDIGTLWKERRKYAGAVIRKAAELELNRTADEAEINALVQSYGEWVLDSLMSTDADLDNTDEQTSQSLVGQGKMEELINLHCRVMFETGDQQILALNPQLGYLLGKPAQTASNIPQQDKAEIPAPSQKEADTPKKVQNQVTLNIGQGKSFALTLPSSKPKKATLDKIITKKTVAQKAPAEKKPFPKAPVKQKPVIALSEPTDLIPPQPATDTSEKPQIKVTSAPKLEAKKPEIIIKSGSPSTAGQEILATAIPLTTNDTKQLSADISFAASKPAKRVNTGASIIQLGSFSQKKNAEKALLKLKQEYPALFENISLEINPHHLNTGTLFYRVETSVMDKGQAKTICDILWAARIPCLLKTA